jgi:hypothetical protein
MKTHRKLVAGIAIALMNHGTSFAIPSMDSLSALEARTNVFDLQHLEREMRSFLERHPNFKLEGPSVTGSMTSPSVGFMTAPATNRVMRLLYGQPNEWQELTKHQTHVVFHTFQTWERSGKGSSKNIRVILAERNHTFYRAQLSTRRI